MNTHSLGKGGNMKLYINTKQMTFLEEQNEIEHNIILRINDIEFYGHDLVIDLPDDDKFINDTLKIEYKKDKDGKDTDEIEDKQFIVREQKTWNSFPLYEVINNGIVDFDYTNYAYFADTDRRMALAQKVNALYNPPSEAKIIRKTLKKILDHLGIEDESFEKYNNKVETIIKNNPKNWKN